MKDEVKVSLPLINGILQYLGSRPYGEVFNLVNAIHEQATPQIQVPTTAEQITEWQGIADANHVPLRF